VDFAPKIRANAVLPGFVRTANSQVMVELSSLYQALKPENVAKSKSRLLTKNKALCKIYLRMRRNRKQDNPIKGHPLTNQRRLLLELLRSTEGHIDAKELYRRASVKDKSISQATVYRTLNLFKELGLVNEMRFGRIRCYYEVKQSPEHQHLVCRGCGKVIEFQSPYFKKVIEAAQQEHGFQVTKAALYLEGYCPECEEK
jgi:Fe2+ or Zn2+ uptake regulation protein